MDPLSLGKSALSLLKRNRFDLIPEIDRSANLFQNSLGDILAQQAAKDQGMTNAIGSALKIAHHPIAPPTPTARVRSNKTIIKHMLGL